MALLNGCQRYYRLRLREEWPQELLPPGVEPIDAATICRRWEGVNPGSRAILVESGQLLEKIHRHLSRSRLVIAKVDQDNLNVYFELGLAMGMKKDVVLVSEDSLVLSLPSDLRNWECVTYPRGNYGELANRVTSFLEAGYGLDRVV